ncbi:AsnC family transcriptional regulator [Gordonia sp. CPCC 205515]|uniref:Lrp/AsnC family transcriptional regulator n=1 Tax=Gordonia sp. CPCC 205515 TaxID=3140791 RepID=UPI003AF346E5
MQVNSSQMLDSDSTTSDSLESDSSSGGAVDGVRFDEVDLALIEALQINPRAPWARIGAALDMSASTAARRWERLTDAGLAWVTAYHDPTQSVVAYLELQCRPADLEPLIGHLTELPWVFSVEQVAGDFDLFLGVVATDPPALARAIGDLAALPAPARAVTTRMCLHLYREGSDWLVRTLDRDQRTTLDPATTHRDQGPAAGADEELLRALSEDGRRSFTELSAITGIAEPTARRRVQRMLRRDEITLRCDFAQHLAGWPLVVTYRMNVPSAQLDTAGRTLARHPDVRLCASVTGRCNLLLSTWARSNDEGAHFESSLGQLIPGLQVLERTVTLRTVKRMGRQLLGPGGTATGHVPIGLHV